MKSIYWFRNDLRLNDNLTLNDAIESSDELLFIYIQDTKNSKETEWKFSRMGRHRRSFISQGLSALSNKLSEYGHSLNYYSDDSLDRLLKLVDKLDRKSTRLNSSHDQISYAVFCLKKKNKKLY